MEIAKKINKSAAVYAITNSEGTNENGKISKPEREGKLMPQIRSSRNKI
jgi:hypothetical protein